MAQTIATTPVSSDDMQARVALELAVGISPVADILKQFGLRKEQLKAMLQEQGFRNMVSQYKQEWLAASNAKERIRLKAAVMAEHNLLILHDIINDMDLNPTARLEAYKQVTALADVQPKKDVTDTGSRFSVTINIPGAEPMSVAADRVIEGETDG